MAIMVDADRPRPLFGANIDPLAGTPMRSVAAEELARILKAHELYVETGGRAGKRADLRSTELSGLDFSGMKLRRVQMSHAELAGANFVGTDLRRANMIGAKLQGARLTSANLTRARLSGINLSDATC
ncbi:MAG: pentapeptide repeat-containing protein [Proteobacteria bacterium]|nr:pentapeptide repeat-containing protein [Pseudomonadota bacterium]